MRVPLDTNLSATGVPTPPESYEPQITQLVPVETLERPIVIAPPLSSEALKAVLGVPDAGQWTATYAEGVLTCPDDFTGAVDSSSSNGPRNLFVLEDGDIVELHTR